MSGPTITCFDSEKELFDYLEEQAAEGAKLAKTWPIKVEDFGHGDHFISMRPDHDCVIFGTVWTRCEEYPEDDEVIADSRSRGYLYGDCFSILCVDGEIGSTHITRVNAKISKAVFERAKANGWRHLRPSN